VLRGDVEAERAFIARFEPVVAGCVRRLARGSRVSEHDIEDMVSDVWLSLWENDKHRLRRFDARRDVRVSTWIGALARNRSIDYLRGLQRPGNAEEVEQVDPAPLPPDELEWRERVALASRAMDELSEEERVFLRTLCVDELESEEIAEQLGIALATVYSRRFKIAAKLARAVEKLQRDRQRRPSA